MRTSLLLGTLIVACAAAAGLVLLGHDDSRPAEPDATRAHAPDDPDRDTSPATRDEPAGLREWRTLATLREDLRDVLAAPEGSLDRTFREVSNRLSGSAVNVLSATAPEEASPRVRALLVLAAGRHRPDDPRLLQFLQDRFPVVREAAALAAGWSEQDDAQVTEALAGVRVPTGRLLPESTAEKLRDALDKETDPQVRETIESVLSAQ